MLWVSSCCTLLSASNLIWLLATAEQTWRAWAWDATSNHILRWGSLWGTGHVLRDVMMIVPSKEPSVRALLKKHYVFYYSALSEIWIWKTLLRQSDISNWGSFFFCCVLVNCIFWWQLKLKFLLVRQFCWELTEDVFAVPGDRVAFWLKIKMEVMSNSPFPHFHWCIYSIWSYWFLFQCVAAPVEGGEEMMWAVVVGSLFQDTVQKQWLVSYFRDDVWRSRCMSCKSTVISKLARNGLRISFGLFWFILISSWSFFY